MLNKQITEHDNLVSVIVPVYNGGKYLKECLLSIEKQTYKNFECIINDNKSTDDTLEIARDFEKRDKRFKVYANDEFLGQTENWNKSMEWISPDAIYIKIVPADDWIFPEYLSEMVGVMDKNDQTGICSSYRLDETKVRCTDLSFYDGPVFKGDKILLLQLRQYLEVTGSINTVMYRKSVLEKISNYPHVFELGKYHIDTLLAYEVLNKSDLGFVFQVLSFTRRHNETYTSKISDKFNTKYYLIDITVGRYLNRFPELKGFSHSNRLKYASYLLKCRLIGSKESYRWHMKYIEEPIKTIEYIESMVKKIFFMKR